MPREVVSLLGALFFCRQIASALKKGVDSIFEKAYYV